MPIPIITPLNHYFKVYYGYTGKKLYILCLIIFWGAISEGFGISMLLPVLNINKPESALDPYTKTIYRLLEFSGIEVSLLPLLVLLFIAFLFKGAFSFLQTFLSLHISTNIIKKMRIGLCQKFKAMNYSYYTNVSIGYLNNIVTTETDRALASLDIFTRVLVSIIFITIYVSAAFIFNWNVTFVVLITCFFMFALFRILSRTSRKISILLSETNAHIQSLLIQTIYNFKYLKATDSFTNVFRHLFKKIDEHRSYRFRNGILLAVPQSIIEPASVLFLSGLLLYYVSYKGIPIAEIAVLLLFFYRTFSRVFRFQIDWQKFNASIGGIETVRKATKNLDLNREFSGSHCINNFNKEIRLEHVNFSHNSKQTLFNINMVIPRNKTIGIVGESGAGKTTLFDILIGLLAPESGKVTVDGVAYKYLDFASLRNIIGYIIQEPVIFNDTIANNISFWENNLDEKTIKSRIENAAYLANCVDFINRSEDGYNTVIGDRGIKLSGGQLQRIAIAREIFKDPLIMIFDEATSSLDTESEKFIQNSINSMMGKKTLIIIAHRLSTIRHCDYIYVLKEGRIVNEGGFDELYEDKDSIFSKMCQAQNVQEK